MDQVPRYFESEQKHSITKKGSREVLMRKGGSNHRELLQDVYEVSIWFFPKDEIAS
jgi:hypothetical protein